MTYSNRTPFIDALESRVLLADAVVVKDIIAGAESSVSLGSQQFIAYNGKLIFAAIDQTHGEELWISDGTEAGTSLLKDLDPGGNSSSPYQFIIGDDGILYFSASMGADENVWKTDGTPGGTVQLTNLGAAGSPVFLKYVNAQVLFFTAFGNDDALWKTTAAGGQQRVSSVTGLNVAVAGGKYFYSGSDDNLGRELYASDGTTTALVKDIYPGSFSSSPSSGATLNGKVFFSAFDPVNDAEPWVSDGTAGGTKVLQNINPTDNSSPRDFIPVGGKLYFVANGSGGQQIYVTTGAGATAVTSFPFGGTITALADFGGTLVFRYQASTGPATLYKLAGGTTATRIGSATGGADGGISPANATAVGSTLFFTGLDNSGIVRLFQTDGVTISLVGGEAGLNPFGLVNVNGTLFFQGDDPARGSELRAVNGVAPAKLTVSLKANVKVISEGESVTFTAAIAGPDIKSIQWDFEGNGVLKKTGRKPTVKYLDNLPDNAVRVVRAKVTATDGQIVNKSISIKVLNVTPTIKGISLPGTGVRNFAVPVRFTVKEPGELDAVDLTVIWGDGEPENFSVGKSNVVSTSHTYEQNGTYSLRIALRDKDGATSIKRKTITIGSLQPFGDTVQQNLIGITGPIFGGTPGNDVIRIANKFGPAGKLLGYTFFLGEKLEAELLLSDLAAAGIKELFPILIIAGKGDDRVKFSEGVTARFKVVGGDGNDTLFSGKGKDTLLGGAGADKFPNASGGDVTK